MSFRNLQLKRKIVKILRDTNNESPLRKSVCLSKPDTILLRLWDKNFLTKIYRNLQTFASKVLQECSSWASRIDCFFQTPNRKMLAGKFANWDKFLVVLREHIIFNIKWVEVLKMSEVFWKKLYCKMLALRLKIKNVHWNVWTNIKKLYTQNRKNI